MTAILTLVKSLSWEAWLIVALAVAGAAVYAEKTGHIKLLEHELTSMTKDRDGLKNEIAMAKDLATKTEAENKAKEAKVAADQKENAIESQRFAIRARDDSSLASAALASLLARAQARSGQAASNPAVAAGSTADEGTGLRTDLLGSVGAEAIRYARIADEARGRGVLCEGDADTVVDTYGDH